ncbi:50S ribosomal protein L29 [bacterium]|nr:50S ribosomal protein L29 [bacterium]
MKAKELVAKSAKELSDYIAEQRKALVEAHIDLRTKEVKNVKAIHNIRRDLARALTIQRQNELKDSQKEASNE